MFPWYLVVYLVGMVFFQRVANISVDQAYKIELMIFFICSLSYWGDQNFT